ncbi:MAG: DUF1508 domain-containing protein [Candidatus Bipolaricaulaceae bacterium]
MQEGYFFELYKAKSDEYRWRFRAPNNKIMADSGEGYKNKEDAQKAIECIKRYAKEAPIRDLAQQPSKWSSSE